MVWLLLLIAALCVSAVMVVRMRSSLAVTGVDHPSGPGWIEVVHSHIQTGWSNQLQPVHGERIVAKEERPHREGLIPPPQPELENEPLDDLAEEPSLPVTGRVTSVSTPGAPVQ